MESSNDPRAHYATALAERQERLREADIRHVRLGYLRLACFAVLGYFAYKVLYLADWPLWWLLAPVMLFAALLMVHARALEKRDSAARSVAYFEAAIQRMDGNWVGRGNAGNEFLDSKHPYAADLDLFGKGSMFERLNLARTSMGQAMLASWLLRPAPNKDVRLRERGVAELGPDVNLREALFLIADDVRTSAHPAALREWAAAPPASTASAIGVGATAAILFSIAVAGLYAHWWIVPLAVLMVGRAILWLLQSRYQHVLQAGAHAGGELLLFGRAMELMERQQFQSDRLRQLVESTRVAGEPASRRILRLARLTDWIDSLENEAVRVLNAVLLIAPQLAILLEHWRRANAKLVPQWIDALAEWEALVSLGGFHYENPEFVWPTWSDERLCFDAAGLIHPLLPRGNAVPNSVRLDGSRRMLLVSGSNMSGKSTMLRTIGINTVLANAGAPVAASSLLLSPLQPGASIDVHDSLAEGESRFYAEIGRLKTLVDLAGGEPPLLFLLDELFSGTNSRDRRIGAAGLLRGLLEKGAIGLVTTHDLALAELANDLAPAAANVHFTDVMENGRIRFDYRMREGVVQGSNALALMRAVGLSV